MNRITISLFFSLAMSLSAKAQTKAMYDFIVPKDGTLREAIDAANNRKDKDARYRIFILQGEYEITTEGKTTGGNGRQYDDPRLTLKAPNTSIIGEDRDKTICYNIVPIANWDNGFGKANPLEGIGNGDVLIIEKKCNNTYLQDLTLKNSMEDNTGRNIALHDCSDKTIAKNTCLWGYQDSYVSDNQTGRYYFEGGIIRGRTDYICGKGDVVYNGVTFQQCGRGGYIVAPSVPRTYGFVMFDCYIKNESHEVTYYLGRPWGKGTPRAIWLNTKVDSEPITRDNHGYNGWADMSGSNWPALFTEYNTTLKESGEKIDLTHRRSIYTDAEGIQHSNAPFLNELDAKAYSIPKILGAWEAQAIAKDATDPTDVTISSSKISWTGSDDALLYVVCKDGKVWFFTTETSYKVSAKPGENWTVRAANQMGGLGKHVEAKWGE